MAFKHHISFVTYLAANFGCNQLRITPDVISKLLRAAIWTHCVVQFESEQTPFPQTGCWFKFRPAALHRIRFGTYRFVSMSYFYSETNKWWKDWANRWAQPCLATTSNSIEISFHIKKKWLVAARNLISMKTLLILELSQYRKSGSMFPQASWLGPAATAADLGTPCVCARPSDPRKQSQRAAPRAWPLILPSKPSMTFWNSLWRDCQMTCRGSNLDSNLNCAAWSTSCKGFISSESTA